MAEKMATKYVFMVSVYLSLCNSFSHERFLLTSLLVRVTKRVHEAYFANLSKVGNALIDCLSFDLQPSDAFNIAVRCKVTHNYAYKSSELKPKGQACLDTKEFNILSNMVQAVNDEAAEWKDMLSKFRAKLNLKKYT
ncbi:hypothetical protein YC2023_091709 [Brassica napus]